MAMADPGRLGVLAVAGVSHTYAGRPPLCFPDWMQGPGSVVALIGPSGCGKTTLLMLIAGLLELQSGRIEIAGTQLALQSGAARDHERGRSIGIVLQSFQLLPRLSIRENLLAAQYFSGNPADHSAVRSMLEVLGIADLAEERPARLSRGQVQRAAIARALINRPKLLLADEPTSSLDDAAAETSLQLLLSESRRLNAALVIATHDSRVKAQVPTVINLRGG